MRHSQGHQKKLACLVVAACSAFSMTGALAGLEKILDRKFPIGTYCPAESRAAAGVDLSFVAPAAVISITFSGTNDTPAGNWNGFRVDNVAVVAKSVFDANLLSPSPGFSGYYNTSTPPGQTTGGVLNAPSYDFNAAGTTELLLDLFPSLTADWTGQHLYHDTAFVAPTIPATGAGATGGSLGLGLITDGQVAVSASRTISGLTPGQQYVVHFWWYAKETSPLTLTIGSPCADPDGDGFVVCGACDPVAGQTCGECNDSNAHCGADCADQDADGWCVTTDCDDTAATCTNNCAADTDADAIADCRDGCLDADRDGYGTAGGAANTCLGSDCNPANQWCNVSCVDADADGHCTPGDCQDGNPSVANDFPEVNDSIDQNCPGEEGYGVIDEVSGDSGFATAGGTAPFSWPSQAGALTYTAERSSSAMFLPTCSAFTTSLNSWTDAVNPPPGGSFFYLVRALTTIKGSWGQGSNGVERAVVCGSESNCGNGVDDDLDAVTDCADTDCNNTTACRVRTFSFVDTPGNDINDDAFTKFLQAGTINLSHFIFFEIAQSSGRIVSWCSERAISYKSQYLGSASTQGSFMSGTWNKWRKAPETGNVWEGPSTTAQLNTYGNDCFGPYSWCSEQFSTEPKNSLLPDRTNDCEAYDLATGACGASAGGTWQLTIKVGVTRALACGF